MKYLASVLCAMICACGASTGDVLITDFKPDMVTIDPVSVRMGHSAKIAFNANGPEGTNVLEVQGKAIEDLTGNVWEEGYLFPYNEAVPYIYYPEVMEGTAMVYRMRFGNGSATGAINWWTQWSDVPVYTKSKKSMFMLVKLVRSWEDAKEWCLVHNMRLASITDESERLAAKDLLLSHGALGESVNEAWIGLYDDNYNDDETTARDWKWIGGGSLNAQQAQFFEENGSSLATNSDPEHPESFNHVKFNIEGNFYVSRNEDEDNDKDEFLCKKMKTKHVAKTERQDGGVRKIV